MRRHSTPQAPRPAANQSTPHPTSHTPQRRPLTRAKTSISPPAPTCSMASQRRRTAPRRPYPSLPMTRMAGRCSTKPDAGCAPGSAAAPSTCQPRSLASASVWGRLLRECEVGGGLLSKGLLCSAGDQLERNWWTAADRPCLPAAAFQTALSSPQPQLTCKHAPAPAPSRPQTPC